MPGLPIDDAQGNRLVALDGGSPQELWEIASELSMPLSLVVVHHGREVLLGFNRWRQQWELPGGTIDDEESPQEAAERELYEDTGVTVWGPALVGVATFVMSGAEEAAALYEHVVEQRPETRVSDELTALTWWDVESEPPDGASPIDAAIARWVLARIR